MCGIIGCIGPEDTLDVLLDGLSTLDYRGYDSAGVALANGDLDVVKRAGQIDALRAAIADRPAPPSGGRGIGHTRWSTHGPPSDANAHPHTSEDGRVAVVHNGIIENYQSLRDRLEGDGVTFTSDTDTEVVPHLIARYLADRSPKKAVRAALDELRGSYAIAAAIADEDAIYGARQDSPLIVGVGDRARYLASDVPAILERTRDVAYLEDGDLAVLTPSDWSVLDAHGTSVDRTVETVDWTAEQTGKGGYAHFMLKEIHEQPTALRQCLSGRVDELSGRISVEALKGIPKPPEVHLVAAGTSYHAAVYGAQCLRQAGVPAAAHLASEYATDPAPVDETLVVGVTQSGETADTLSAIRTATGRGASTLAVTNVVGSTAARECDHTMYIRSGPEIGVAATKTFSAQLVALTMAIETLLETSDRELVAALRDLPGAVQAVLDDTEVDDVVDTYVDSDAYFFIGRGIHYPVALEGALKFKEITYEHAEGFAAGELKHGPLALVTDETPVFAIVSGSDERARKTVANVKEVEARDAPVVAVTDGAADVGRYADHVLSIPKTRRRLAPVLANLQLQLVAYHMADRLGRPIDKPRNLAKSVTVE